MSVEEPWGSWITLGGMAAHTMSLSKYFDT